MTLNVIKQSLIVNVWFAFADCAVVGKRAAAGRATPAGEGRRPLQVQ